MTSVVTGTSAHAERSSEEKEEAIRHRPDNVRDESLGRFAPVLMMPIVLIATLAAIIFYLSPGA